MSKDDENLAPQVLSSVRRLRVASGPVDGCPTREQLGIDRLGAAAVQWQTQRNYGEWNELAFVRDDLERSPWVPEVHGLFGVAGELVIVATEAEADVVLSEWDAADADNLAARISAWRSIRFFAEGQGNNLVVFGHTVANLTVRTLALYPTFNTDQFDPRFGAAFGPVSPSRDAWLGLNKYTARELKRTADPLGPAALALAELVRELPRGPWGRLNDLRGEQYHRWRGESPGFPGVNFLAPRMHDRLQAGQTVGIGGSAPEYTEGFAVLEDLMSAVRQTMAQLETWMPGYLELWTNAFDEVRVLNGGLPTPDGPNQL